MNGCGARHGELQHLRPVHEAYVLEVVDAFLRQTGDLERVSRCGDDLDRRGDTGANEIADFPYVFGGGHASFVDNAYDCSGSVSYALAAGGLLSAPETSGDLESWGAAGPGRYITVYANAGHTFMYVNGISAIA